MKTLAILLTLIFAMTAYAEVINVPDDHETIQGAIDAAEDGDTVLVAPGEYVENINFEGKAIAVIGNPDDPGEVTIDGNADGSVVVFDHREDENSMLIGFTVANGDADQGGGIFCNNQVSPLIKNVHIVGNQSADGGGIYSGQMSNPTLENVLFERNESSGWGGAVSVAGSVITIRNSDILNNSAYNGGGGIYCSSNGIVDYDYGTLRGNTITNVSGGAASCNSATMYLSHLLIADNGRNGGYHTQIHCANIFGQNEVELTNITMVEGRNSSIGIDAEYPQVRVTNCIVRGHTNDDVHMGRWNPTYSNVGGVNRENGNIDEDPLFADPDNGDYTLTEDSPCIDTGDPDSPEDPDGTHADMGAYYFPQRDPDDDGVLHVPDEYETIQEAIDAAEDGDTVLVAPGEYVENIVIEGDSLTIGSLYLLGSNEAYIDSTIIDGNGEGSVVTRRSEDWREYNEIVGFTIRNGRAQNGGGIHCEDSGYLMVVNCLITENYATNAGGGAYSLNSRFETIKCRIINNSAGLGGGIFGNDLAITKTLVADNIATSDGTGGIYCMASAEAEIFGSTISNNVSAAPYQNGGGIFVSEGAGLYMDGLIIWGNAFPQIVADGESEMLIIYSCIEGGRDSIVCENGEFEWGRGNVTEDPNFVDPDEGVYLISEDSPCIDTGNPWEFVNDPDGTRADMGAFYFHQNFPPEGFDLLSPENGSGIEPHDTTAFRWELSEDPNPDDEVMYLLTIMDTSEDRVRTFEADSNSFTLVLGEIFDMGDVDYQFEWFVYAVSNEDTVESESHYTFRSYGDGVDDNGNTVPTEFALISIHPNPFNSTTTISYSIPQAQQMKIQLHDISGRLVETLNEGQQAAGHHSTLWDSREYGAGIYFVKIQTETETKIAKLVAIK